MLTVLGGLAEFEQRTKSPCGSRGRRKLGGYRSHLRYARYYYDSAAVLIEREMTADRSKRKGHCASAFTSSTGNSTNTNQPSGATGA